MENKTGVIYLVIKLEKKCTYGCQYNFILPTELKRLAIVGDITFINFPEVCFVHISVEVQIVYSIAIPDFAKMQNSEG